MRQRTRPGVLPGSAESLGVPRAEIARRVAECLGLVGLAGFERREPATLSGGEKQRLAIASVLAMRPSLILLDEPTTDLDPVGKGEVHAILRRLAADGLAVAVIEHETEELLDLDRILHLDAGAVRRDGPPRRLLLEVAELAAAGVEPPVAARASRWLGLAEVVREERFADEVAARGVQVERTGVRPRLATRGEAPVIEVDHLVHRYPLRDQPAVDDVSLAIRPGEFVALLGANGSGKTTLAKHLNGLLPPTSGAVRVAGHDAKKAGTAQLARHVGYVFQDPDHQIFSATVWEEMAFGPRNLGVGEDQLESRILAALEVVGLTEERDRDPFVLTKGQRQRLAVASVLATAPEILVLDEPTTGLDYNDRERMLALLADLHRRGHTVLVITHAMEVVASHCERALVMAGGKLVFDGGIPELFANDEVLARARLRAPTAWRLGRMLGLETLTPEELGAALRGGGGGNGA
ncbi:MAG: ATP-binding cassette domain-containing protein [Deltaproteobacteria bacterium]|nr:ATP-binding cassette domain-containing protein [Deltaproteobacteria bacterium]